jgi:hypothetical protein
MFSRTLTGFLIGISIFAARESIASQRMSNRFGVYVDTTLAPFVLLNVGYNLADFARVHGGAGTGLGSGSVVLFGGGFDFMVPDWNFTPFLGVNYYIAQVSISGKRFGSAGGISVDVGAEYHSSGGWLLGLGTYLGGSISPFFRFGKFF